MNTEQLICGVSATEIETLKAENGALVLVNVTTQGKVCQAIFKEPTFKDLEIVGTISKSNEIKGARASYDNLIVKADKEIEKRDLLKIKAVEALMRRVQKTTAEAKNL